MMVTSSEVKRQPDLFATTSSKIKFHVSYKNNDLFYKRLEYFHSMRLPRFPILEQHLKLLNRIKNHSIIDRPRAPPATCTSNRYAITLDRFDHDLDPVQTDYTVNDDHMSDSINRFYCLLIELLFGIGMSFIR